MTFWDKPLLRHIRPDAGWTVVEVLIGLAALAVIILLSAPSINTLSQNYHQKKTSSDLLSSLTLAQEEAARRRGITRLCPSSDGSTCRTDGNWNRGWVVYLDINANNQPEALEILDRYGPADEKIRILAEGSFKYHATFNVDGRPTTKDGADEGKFKVCFSRGDAVSQEVLVNENGLVQAAKTEQSCSKI